MLVSRVYYATSGPWNIRNIQSIKFFLIRHQKELEKLQRAPLFSKSIFRTKSTTNSRSSSIVETKENEQGQLTVGEKIKQTTKDVSYLGVILVGISVTGIMFYAIIRELFSGHSSNSVYSEALKRCKKDNRVIDAVGKDIKGFGEETARGRRRHVSYMKYIKDDVNYMRMKFYIQGSRRKGTVHVEVKENDKKKYEYRYLFVDLEGYPPKTIVLEDNREQNALVSTV